MEIKYSDFHSVELELSHHDIIALYTFYEMVIDYIKQHDFKNSPLLNGLEKEEIQHNLSIFEDLFSMDEFNFDKHNIL